MLADEYFRSKESVPSEMRTAEWERAGTWAKERAYYSAAVAEAEILDEMRRWAQKVVEGTTDESTARVQLQLFLDRIGYKAAPGQEGTIKDLSSRRRLTVMLRTNRALAQGYAEKVRGFGPGAIRLYPAWELIRLGSNPQAPRDWIERWTGKGGGELTADGRMIALKQDLIWAELGSKGNFEDALGVDYPPFAWGSGMGWRAVKHAEAKALGLLEGWKPPETKPLPSPNESLQVKPRIQSPALRKELGAKLAGLAEWVGDVLVFTDPNGTRPYSAQEVAKVVTAKLPNGMPSLQAKAAEIWSDSAAMIHKRPASDVASDFIRLVERTEPMRSDVTVWRGEGFHEADVFAKRVAHILSGGNIGSVGRGFSLIEDVAEEITWAYNYRLIIKLVKHRSVREIYPTVGEVNPVFEPEKEVILLGDKRLRVIGQPKLIQTPRGEFLEVEVEEI